MKLNKPFLFKLFVALIGAVALLLSSGCTSPAQSANMTPTALGAPVQAKAESVHVRVGEDSGEAGMAQISDQAFKEAIVQAISQTGLFADIAEEDSADLVLYVSIMNTDQPAFGFSMTVNLEVYWKLMRKSDNSMIWQDTITSSYTAGATDAFSGAKRVRFATEGAARKNIEEALTRINALEY